MREATTLLTVYVVLLFAIPSRLTFAPLGGAGSPAMVLGLLLGVLWAFLQVQQGPRERRFGHPVRRALAVLLVAFAISYVFAMTRAIQAEEVSTADLGLVLLVSWAGVLLLTHDCLPDLDAFATVLRRLVIGGAVVAAVGLAQYVTGQALVDHIHLPGLSENSGFGGVGAREGFNRPFSTALHPIEFGAVLTSLLPLALTSALVDPSRGRIGRWIPLTLIVTAVTLSVSRSAIVGAVVGIACLVPAIPRRTLPSLLAGLLSVLVALFLVVPGMLGTMLGLFTSAGDDSSVASRTGSYALAGTFFERSPLFGRGFGTFLPRYRILDNQYLLSLIDVGLVGVLAVIALFATAVVVLRRARRITRNAALQLQLQGLLGGIVAGAVGLALFDGFSFPMGSSLLILLVGLAGAAYRLVREDAEPGPRHHGPAPVEPRVAGGERHA